MMGSRRCEYCYCISGSRRCIRPKCLLPLPGCTPLYAPHSCCPVAYNCTRECIFITSTSTSNYLKYLTNGPPYFFSRPPSVHNGACIGKRWVQIVVIYELVRLTEYEEADDAGREISRKLDNAIESFVLLRRHVYPAVFDESNNLQRNIKIS